MPINQSFVMIGQPRPCERIPQHLGCSIAEVGQVMHGESKASRAPWAKADLELYSKENLHLLATNLPP